LFPNEFCLLLKARKFAAERNPACVADEVAIVKVQVADEEVIRKPEAPEVANVPINLNVRSAERSPPPARPKPEFIALDEETAEMPSENVAVFAS